MKFDGSVMLRIPCGLRVSGHARARHRRSKGPPTGLDLEVAQS